MKWQIASRSVFMTLFVSLNITFDHSFGFDFSMMLEVRGKIIRTVLCCTVYRSHKHTQMSNFSSLDWILSHWAPFTVCRFICVCEFCVNFLYCIAYVLYYYEAVSVVVWTWWDWSLILGIWSFSALTLLVGSFDPLKLQAHHRYDLCLVGC